MLGDLVSPIPLVDPNPIKPVPMPAPTSPKPTFAEQVSKWIGIGKEAAEIYTTVKNPPSGTQQWPANYTPPVQAPSNTLKYVLIGGAVIAAGWGVYMVTKSSK